MNDAIDVSSDELWDADKLGAVLEIFRPSKVFVFSQALICLICAAVVVWLLAIWPVDPRFQPLCFMGLLISTALCLGIGYVAVGCATLDVQLCERGFSCNRSRRRAIFLWKEISAVRADLHFTYASESDRQLNKPCYSTRSFTVTNVDGDSFFFGDFAELKMAEPLVIALREVAGRYGFAWEDRETHEVEQARG